MVSAVRVRCCQHQTDRCCCLYRTRQWSACQMFAKFYPEYGTKFDKEIPFNTIPACHEHTHTDMMTTANPHTSIALHEQKPKNLNSNSYSKNNLTCGANSCSYFGLKDTSFVFGSIGFKVLTSSCQQMKRKHRLSDKKAFTIHLHIF